MTDRELIKRLLFLAQTAVDQALDLNYDDPEDYFIYRELRELKAAALAQPEPALMADLAATLIADSRQLNPEMAAVLTPEARWDLYGESPTSQPEPQGPTVMQILALSDVIEAEELGTIDLVRRALARWGHPATELEGADD